MVLTLDLPYISLTHKGAVKVNNSTGKKRIFVEELWGMWVMEEEGGQNRVRESELPFLGKIIWFSLDT